MKIIVNLIVLLLLCKSTFAQLKVGDKAPNFKLWLTDGSKITQNETKGKIVVFKFWFTSCVPCIKGIPKLNTLVEKYKTNTDIMFIAPAIDNSDVVRRFLKRYPFNFKIAYSANDVSQVYNPNKIFPSYFIINKKGVISYIDSQTKDLKEDRLEEEIVKLLNNN
jgi:peroxiredoxin